MEAPNPPTTSPNLLKGQRPFAKHFLKPSLAKQSFKQECDINNIMRKFQKTGLVDHLNTHNGEYGNFIHTADYHSSLNQILEAEEMFATIPSSIRKKFDNDPSLFLDFVQDPENIPEMIEMGLANPAPPEAPTDPSPKPATPVADPPAEAPEAPAATPPGAPAPETGQ